MVASLEGRNEGTAAPVGRKGGERGKKSGRKECALDQT